MAMPTVSMELVSTTATESHSATSELLGAAQTLVVHDDGTDACAKELLVQATTAEKRIDSLRRRFTDPLNAQVKSINADFKPAIDDAKAAGAVLRQKTGAYFMEQQAAARAAQQAAERAARQEAARVAAAAIKRNEPPVVTIAPAPAVATPAKSTSTGSGARVTMREVRKYEVVDFAALPDEYKTVDDTKLGKVIRAGVDSIPGVRVYTEVTAGVK